MAKEILHAYSVNKKAFSGVLSVFDGCENGSMMILDSPTAKSLSGDFENAVVINNKEVVFSDGINPGYWKTMFSNPNVEPIIAIKKMSDSRYDIGCFRPGCIPLSGLVFKNDPAELSCDNSNGWYFIQALHADPPGGRYQDVATASGLLLQCDKMRAFNRAEIASTPALTYFDSELTKNSQYCDKMIAKKKIEFDPVREFN